MSGFYYKDWREVFKWPRIGDRGTGEAGNPQGSFGRAGGRRHLPNERQQRRTEQDRQAMHATAPDFIGSRPKDETRTIWQVHDVFLQEGKLDAERLVSEHPTRPEARRAARLRAQHYDIANAQQDEPGPYLPQTSHGYTAQYEKPSGDMQEGLN